LTNNLSLRVNLASGFRAPNLAELTSYGSHEGTGRFEIGDPNLDNEQNIQLDLALEYTSKHIEVFANGFYNLVNNYIYIEPNGELMNEDPVFLYVQNDAKLYGGEAGFHLHPHPLDWLHFESSFETVFGEQDGSDLPLIPATNLNNTLRVEFANNWLKKGYAFTKLSTTFKQDKVSYFETSTNGYSLLSAGLGATFNWKKAKFGVSLTGTNLLDKTYVSHLSRLKPDGIYNIGRNFSIGVNVQI
ncbi:MAG: TonB-dependent receptor, partial [Mangrovimonas sp.]|nr:TonB-dependent receptor [Mangrovimonas sp.]